jgi:hypothetical protein
VQLQNPIAGLFVGADPSDRDVDAQAGKPRGIRFAMIAEGTRGAPDPECCRETLSLVAPGGYAAVALELPDGGRSRRMAAILTLSSRMAAAERTLERCGAEPAGRYGVAPDLRAPTILYQIGSAAARYGEEHLLLSPRPLLASALCAIFRLWTGCDPSLGAVLVVGRKP